MDPECTRIVAHEWYLRLSPTPHDAASITSAHLEPVAHQLIAVLATDPFDPQSGAAVGAHLVRLTFTDPAVLPHTAVIVAAIPRLLASRGIPAVTDADRIAALVGTIGAGYAHALSTRVGPNRAAPAQSSSGHQRREANLQLPRVFEHAAVAVAICTANGRVIDANPALGAMLGCDPTELTGSSVTKHVHPLDRERIGEVFRQLVITGSGTARVEARYVRADSDEGWGAWTMTAVPSTTGIGTYVLTIGEDITERRAADEALRQLALHDHLTGLANRANLLYHLDVEIHQEIPRIGAVLYCDLIDFKTINDTHGHIFGDTILRTAALRMKRAIGADDMVARFGGDEFVIAVAAPAPNGHTAELAEQLRITLASPILTPTGEPLQIRVAIGWTQIAEHDQRNVDQILHDADTDMYRRRKNNSPMNGLA